MTKEIVKTTMALLQCNWWLHKGSLILSHREEKLSGSEQD